MNRPAEHATLIHRTVIGGSIVASPGRSPRVLNNLARKPAFALAFLHCTIYIPPLRHPRRLGRNIMLQIDNLVFNGWGRKFFDQASVSLPVGAKVGLVGRNGVGKSTLFRLILGELHPDGGEISLPKLARIASVDQEHPATPVSLIDTILAADTEREALNGALETAEPEEMGEIYARLIEI